MARIDLFLRCGSSAFAAVQLTVQRANTSLLAAEVRSAASDVSTNGLLILPEACRKMRFYQPSLAQR